jgi:hypothetical protein
VETPATVTGALFTVLALAALATWATLVTLAAQHVYDWLYIVSLCQRWLWGVSLKAFTVADIFIRQFERLTTEELRQGKYRLNEPNI